MSSIAPNSQIRFLTGVPIDKNYENSLDFLSLQAQLTYFYGLTPVHTMVKATRVRDGVISVDKLADELLIANYMMFQNTNFGNKWFYAFITNIEYVNNNMCYVYYQIDDIQTWMFDVTLEECYIVREHTQTDQLFEHLIPEDFGVSEHVVRQINEETFGKGRTIIVYTGSKFEKDSVTHQWQLANPKTADPTVEYGLATMLVSYNFDLITEQGLIDTGEIDELRAFINAVVEEEQKDGIICAIEIPTNMMESTHDYDAKIIDVDIPSRNWGNNYVPKNKKLYNSPYCVYTLGTSDGQHITLQPEFFNTPSSNSHSASILCDVSPNPSVTFLPREYNQKDYDYEHAMTLDAFPQVPITIDGYQAWIASGGLAKTNAQIASTVATAGLSALALGLSAPTFGATAIVGGLTIGASASSSIAQDMISLEYAKKLPTEVKGNVNATPLIATNNVKVYTTFSTITYDSAKAIDEYFTMFGYKVNKVKTPSRRNRPHYTYLKTKGLHVNGGAPADAIERIEAIYDNGIRFWVNPSEVGHYSTIDNSPS